jgi:hypothetical protein
MRDLPEVKPLRIQPSREGRFLTRQPAIPGNLAQENPLHSGQKESKYKEERRLKIEERKERALEARRAVAVFTIGEKRILPRLFSLTHCLKCQCNTPSVRVVS